MKTSCPSCGAEIEFRYDDSFVRICSHCEHAVQRTDRGLETLGKVADLVPIESPLRLFATGRIENESFILVGMAQIRHAAGGIWQEWYAKLANGRWGWLAEAQGRFYLTFHDPTWRGNVAVLAPGDTLEIGGREMTVAEATSGTYVSARGELPYRLVPGETFQYADLGDGKGGFATIDFGDGDPALYVGAQVTLADLHVSGGEADDRPAPAIGSKDLTCPSCAAPIQLHAAGDAQRFVCSHCNALLDTSSGGALAVLAKLKQKPELAIPLGKTGTFSEGELTVIAYLQRSAFVDDAWWPFYEYLLYRPDLGFRWLVSSDGHWSYVQPIAEGAVDTASGDPKYDGVRFRSFQSSELRVDEVLGEVYWPVKVGEKVQGDDFIAPPAMLSRESSKTEETWSLGTYMTPDEVTAAFGGSVTLPYETGIGPNQPDPWGRAASLMTYAFAALLLVGVVFSIAAKNQRVYETALTFQGSAAPAPAVAPSLDDAAAQLQHQIDAQMQQTLDQMNSAILGSAAPGSAAGSAGGGSGSGGLAAGSGSAGSDVDAGVNVVFSDPFTLRAGENVELRFDAPTLSNNWVYVAADLVNQATGDVVNLEAEMDYYAGVDDGESWSEGSRSATVRAGPQPAGTYVVRFEGQVGSGTETVDVTVHQGVFRGAYLALALLVLGFPFGIAAIVSYLHEKRRWENSTTGQAPTTPVSVFVLCIAFPFVALAFILKAWAASND